MRPRRARPIFCGRWRFRTSTNRRSAVCTRPPVSKGSWLRPGRCPWRTYGRPSGADEPAAQNSQTSPENKRHEIGILTSLSVHSGFRTLASLCFVSVRYRPRSVDSASVKLPLTRISRYVSPSCLALSRYSSLAERSVGFIGEACAGQGFDCFDCVGRGSDLCAAAADTDCLRDGEPRRREELPGPVRDDRD